jgi:hypothetical protein
MGIVLDKIRAKITRAEQHIRELQLAIQAFAESNPYAISMRENAHSGKRIYYLSKVDCVPNELTTIAADVIQNLRSPLDQIAYQLVLDSRSGAPPEWNIYYPITRVPAEYKATRNGFMQGVRQEVVDAIDATEPYPGGRGHALWQLNELNKPDKHRLLVNTIGSLKGLDISGILQSMLRKTQGFEGITVPPVFLREANYPLPMNVGYELYIEPIENEVNKKIAIVCEIAFDVPGVIEREPVMRTLHDMTNFVRDIVERLGRFLP